MTAWRVHRAEPPKTVPVGEDLWSEEELRRREVAARIKPGSPFMARPDGGVDPVLTAYFNSRSFAGLAQETQESYLKDYRVFFNFMWGRGLLWNEATADDVEDFEDWRRRAPDNPRPIGGSKWIRELSAFNRLYIWAIRAGIMATNPVASRNRVLRDGSVVQMLEATAHDVVVTDVKWLTPRAWQRWRDIGLLGLDAAGIPDASFRGRNGDRNAAYANLLFDSGLRRTEGASLLTIEIPAIDGRKRYHLSRVATAVAKYSSGRPFYVTTTTIQHIEAYRITSRADSVRAAQKSGRYDRMLNKLIVTRMPLAQELIIEWIDNDTGAPRTSRLDRLRVDERQRLYRKTPEGLEPLWLWLAETGTPFHSHSWEAVFTSATERCQKTLGPGAPFCTPHMARHSFALYMLLAFYHGMDIRFKIDKEVRSNLEETYGNPWRLVKDLLGHKSEETTRNVYLGPVRDVEIRALLEGDLSAGADLLQALAVASGRVQDVPNA